MRIKDCILAIDQGTTSTRAIIFAPDSSIIAVAQQEFAQHYPNDGWVEHDPEDIWSSTVVVCRQAISEAIAKGARIAAIGVTNQRETTVVWDRNTGQAIYNAIVWQDRRTAQTCRDMQDKGLFDVVNSRTGLLLDPYFSASKVAWILDNVDGAREKAEAGDLAFGTIDSFLIWRLTDGQMHATDVTNASRTNLFNIHDMAWDPKLLEVFNVPKSVLPEVKECADDFGHTTEDLFGFSLPILGVAGDQQAASIGQCCFNEGAIKSTYGTGCFVMLNTGTKAFNSKNKLLTTVAYTIKGETHYALEGSIFIAGAAIQWLRDGLGVIRSASETEDLAKSLDDDHGVYMVPAFAGLGAPHWAPDARGAVFGLTRGTTNAHFVRAALESVCYQTSDLLHAMAEDGVSLDKIRVDGGMVGNNWLCQFLAGILDVTVERPKIMETTALGAAYLAGLKAGIYQSCEQLASMNEVESSFEASMASSQRRKLISGWENAVQSTLGYSK
ncbi:MAG: glycerol kinase [Alteromonadaceae bacterium]|uniref:Glycerol kinase n=2 Tax=Paraglaciecola chathamensis TaxID=368405 RepID=A0A8H9M2L1_9ALTE|nr:MULTISPECIES: glycerol kinase GlpK [Paraglaciecola]MBN26328.1 glycerol kinase [Alteromonadaceae bacterium]GAC03525.1 glycerol kinase [Paraglaciecola agarilytica NO2]GGZ48176.1 glycerol kinase 1 [Paraglaciecola oceanifecundans]|tara:strand:+ start:59582 stop:61075 length:1494 start_codon:yes stop_codon:yes gene_type:complete